MPRLGAWGKRGCPCLACVTRRAGVAMELQVWVQMVCHHYDTDELARLYDLADASMLPMES